MSFAAAFYNFSITLNNAEQGVFCRFRIKVPLHPLESLEHLSARMLAFTHCYREGQAFSSVLFEPKEPTIWHKDVTGDVLLWAQVGCPDRKKLEHSLRSAPLAEHRIYFFHPEQVERSSPLWNVTIIDDQLYLNCDGIELQAHLDTVDIWDAYQESLAEEVVAPIPAQKSNLA